MNNPSHRKLRFLIPFAIVGFLALFAAAVQALWNGILPDVLGVKAITYWQALGLLVLSKILFGGFPCRGGGPGGWRGRMMARQWEGMTPEQREKMRQEMRSRFGDWTGSPWCRTDREPGEGPAPRI